MQKINPFAVWVPIILVLVSLVVVFGAVGLQVAAGPGDNGETPPGQIVIEEERVNWDEVQRLYGEQKYEAANEIVQVIRERAEAAGDADDWTRAIVEQVKLRSALHGYETAVRFLKETPWPDDEVARAVLDLYYANSLATYVHAYSWEIRQRERVETTGELDLKKWDVDQIVEEANRAYAELWSRRAAWGVEGIGALARYIDQNDYPPRIRGTLRDAVSYLWVEFLADTSLWRPDQTNDVFRLDFAALLIGDPRFPASSIWPIPRSTRWSRSAPCSMISKPGTRRPGGRKRRSRRGSNGCGVSTPPSPTGTTATPSGRISKPSRPISTPASSGGPWASPSSPS